MKQLIRTLAITSVLAVFTPAASHAAYVTREPRDQRHRVLQHVGETRGEQPTARNELRTAFERLRHQATTGTAVRLEHYERESAPARQDIYDNPDSSAS